MNKYIFDWIENCEYMLQTQECFTSRNQYMELKVLIRYLQDQGKDQKEIYRIWRKIVESTPMRFFTEFEYYDKFEEMWKAASNWVILQFNPIIIYKNDIDRINQMEVVPWIKQYLLTLLCVYKYYDANWCPYSKNIKTFCYSMTSVGREFDYNAKLLADCLSRYNPYLLAVYDSKLAIRWQWKNVSGEIAGKIRNPRHTQELFHLIENKKECKNCGELWDYTAHSIHNEICPRCYKKQRSLKKNSYKKKRV